MTDNNPNVELISVDSIGPDTSTAYKLVRCHICGNEVIAEAEVPKGSAPKKISLEGKCDKCGCTVRYKANTHDVGWQSPT